MLRRNKNFKVIKRTLTYKEAEKFYSTVLNYAITVTDMENDIRMYDAFSEEIGLRYAFLAMYTDYEFVDDADTNYNVATSFAFEDFDKKINYDQFLSLLDAIDKQLWYEKNNMPYVPHSLKKSSHKGE